MFTSNFKTCGTHPDAVAISIGKPRGWRGRSYPILAPTRMMLKLPELEFEKQYRWILRELDAQQVYDELGEQSILLCWEPFNGCCHRRMVAEWLEKKLGVVIPEHGHERSESIAFSTASRNFRKTRP